MWFIVAKYRVQQYIPRWKQKTLPPKDQKQVHHVVPQIEQMGWRDDISANPLRQPTRTGEELPKQEEEDDDEEERIEWPGHPESQLVESTDDSYW